MPTDEASIPPQFLRDVRDVLARLFDTAHLQRHSLAAALVPRDLVDPRARAQYLRETISQAVAALKPPVAVSPHEPAYRPYGILRHRYLEGMSAEEVQEALAIGRRQYFREQQRAIGAVTAVLWAQRLPEATATTDAGASLSDELEQLGVRAQPIDLLRLLQEAIDAIHPLAASRAVAISVRDKSGVRALADEDITRQVMIEVLGAVVQRCHGCFVEAVVAGTQPWAAIGLTIPDPTLAQALEKPLLTAARLCTRMGGSLHVAAAGEQCMVTLRLPSSQEKVIAIVDDNPTTQQLFRRYLEPYSFRVVPIQDGTTALREIRQVQPDAVVLDIMMRDVDGWRILQGLRSDPSTAALPVLVCSVLSDEGLALTIGATAYLRKPVSQTELVRALGRSLQRSDASPETSGGRSPASE